TLSLRLYDAGPESRVDAIQPSGLRRGGRSGRQSSLDEHRHFRRIRGVTRSPRMGARMSPCTRTRAEKNSPPGLDKFSRAVACIYTAPKERRMVGAWLCFRHPAKSGATLDTSLLSHPHRAHHRPPGHIRLRQTGQVKETLVSRRKPKLVAEDLPLFS